MMDSVKFTNDFKDIITKESLIDKLENGKIKKHSGSFIAYNREWLFRENNLEMEFDLLRKTRDAKVNKEGE